MAWNLACDPMALQGSKSNATYKTQRICEWTLISECQEDHVSCYSDIAPQCIAF